MCIRDRYAPGVSAGRGSPERRPAAVAVGSVEAAGLGSGPVSLPVAPSSSSVTVSTGSGSTWTSALALSPVPCSEHVRARSPRSGVNGPMLHAPLASVVTLPTVTPETSHETREPGCATPLAVTRPPTMIRDPPTGASMLNEMGAGDGARVGPEGVCAGLAGGPVGPPHPASASASTTASRLIPSSRVGPIARPLTDRRSSHEPPALSAGWQPASGFDRAAWPPVARCASRQPKNWRTGHVPDDGVTAEPADPEVGHRVSLFQVARLADPKVHRPGAEIVYLPADEVLEFAECEARPASTLRAPATPTATACACPRC